MQKTARLLSTSGGNLLKAVAVRAKVLLHNGRCITLVAASVNDSNNNANNKNDCNNSTSDNFSFLNGRINFKDPANSSEIAKNLSSTRKHSYFTSHPSQQSHKETGTGKRQSTTNVRLSKVASREKVLMQNGRYVTLVAASNKNARNKCNSDSFSFIYDQFKFKDTANSSDIAIQSYDFFRMPPATSKRKHEEAVEQFEIKIGLIKKEYVVNSILSADIVDNMWNDYRSLVMSNQTRGPVCRNALSFMLTVGSVYITPQAALDRFYSALRDIEDCGDSLTFSECIELVNVWHRANLLSNSIDHVIEAALSRPNTGLIEALGWKFANLSNSVCLIMLIQQWYSMYAIESKENRNEVKVIDNEILSEFISMLSKVQETEFALLIFQYQKIALEKADFRELELLFPPKKYEQDETYNPKCIPFKIYRELMELLTHPIKVQIAVNHEYGKTLKNTAKRDKNFEFAKIDFTKTRLSLRLGDPSNEEFDQLNVSSFSVALNLFKEAIRLYPPNMNLERTEYENCKFLSLSSVFNFMVIIAAKHNEVNTLDVLLNDMNTFNMDLSTGALCMICAMQIRTFAQTDPENKKILKNLRSLSNLDANIRIPLYESTLKALASCNKFGLIMYVFEIMEQAAYQGKTDDRLKISRRVYETMMISGIEFGRIKSIEILMTLYRAAGYEPDLGLMKILEPYNNSDSDKSAEEHVTFEIFPSPIL